jgi:hypothetical protein
MIDRGTFVGPGSTGRERRLVSVVEGAVTQKTCLLVGQSWQLRPPVAVDLRATKYAKLELGAPSGPFSSFWGRSDAHTQDPEVAERNGYAKIRSNTRLVRS